MKLILFALSSILLASGASAQYKSTYTSVVPKDCTTISQDVEEIDSYNAECPALGGYQVNVLGGDIRYNLDLSYQGMRIPTYKPSAFHDMGASVIEWRYKIVGKGFNSTVEYTALIYRLSISTYTSDDGMPKDKDSLVVVRLNGTDSCVIGIVESGSNMNLKAQAMADDMSKACLLSESVY